MVRPPSSCPLCETPLHARDKVPVLSYLLLRGRCRRCRGRISARYPLIELANATMWIAAAAAFDAIEEAAFVALVSSALLSLTAIDLEFSQLPNTIVLPATACAAVWVAATLLVRSEISALYVALASAVGAFLVFFGIALVSGGMGFGDVKLAAFVGLVTGRFGWQVTFVAIFGAFLMGGIVAAALLVSGRRGRKDAIPFGPSLAAATVVALYGGPELASAWFDFF